MPSFKRSTYDDVKSTGLFEEHWAELPNYGEATLSTSDDIYRDHEENGRLALFVAEDEGEPVAYAGFFLHSSLTSFEMLQATNHALFMKAHLRGKGFGLRFMQFIEQELKSMGVETYTLQFKPHAVPNSFLAALGVEMTEVTFGKYIGE